MTNKKPKIKGRGADFFLDREINVFSEQGKATFYLPKPLIEKLDRIWVDLRKNHRKLKKSDIARVSLGDFLNDYDANHQDSRLLQHLNVKTSEQQ